MGVLGPQAPAPAAENKALDLMQMERDARCGQILVTAIVGGTPMRMLLDTGISDFFEYFNLKFIDFFIVIRGFGKTAQNAA